MEGSAPSMVTVRCARCDGALPESGPGARLECARCCFAMVLAEPTELVGGYRLISALGEGGCGIVYLAREPASGRLVALKLARPGAPLADLIFRKEIKNASKLAHP